MIPIPYRLLTPTAKPPTRATQGSAGLDLYADLPAGPVPIWSQDTLKIPTGLALAIPEGYCGLLVGRSGLGGRGLALLVGLIDSDYRGEIGVVLHMGDDDHAVIRPGDRIAQLLILPVPAVEMVEAADLPGTARGDGGFGSTGR
jgi:dUTP pyrophosphatase